MTALAVAPGGCRATAASGIDRAIRLSTAAASLAVAGIAAYVSAGTPTRSGSSCQARLVLLADAPVDALAEQVGVLVVAGLPAQRCRLTRSRCSGRTGP
jgi:electron transfer flavoprotein alpha/beta subunit